MKTLIEAFRENNKCNDRNEVPYISSLCETHNTVVVRYKNGSFLKLNRDHIIGQRQIETVKIKLCLSENAFTLVFCLNVWSNLMLRFPVTNFSLFLLLKIIHMKLSFPNQNFHQRLLNPRNCKKRLILDLKEPVKDWNVVKVL